MTKVLTFSLIACILALLLVVLIVDNKRKEANERAEYFEEECYRLRDLIDNRKK